MEEVFKIENLNINNFNNLNISIPKGKIVSIIGNNKSGKTELIKIILGINSTNNILSINNVILNEQNKDKYIKNIGIVFPYYDYPYLYKNTKDELMYPLKNLGYNKIKSINIIKKTLKKLNKSDLYKKEFKDLDNNSKQIIVFILGLIHNPKVLIIDESFNLIDSNSKKIILDIINDLVKQKKLTVIYFSNKLSLDIMSDYIYILDNYQIVCEGTIDNICDNKLYEYGIEIPFMIDLSNKLKTYGLINKTYQNMEEMVNDIWK